MSSLSSIIAVLLSWGVSAESILNGLDSDCNFRDLDDYLENLREFESINEAESFRLQFSVYGDRWIIFSGDIPMWDIRTREGAK